jgi:ribokinase
LSSADVRRASRLFRSSSVLLLQLETSLETVATAATLAAACGMRVILNPAPAQALPASLLRRVTILTPNEHEAELLTGIRVRNAAAAGKAADRLLRRGVQNVLVTLGSRGVFVAGPSIHELIPGHKVKPADTTGAGDVFNGALAIAIAEGRPLLDAARFANAAAALSVTRLGAQPSAPTRKAIEHLCRSADSSSSSIPS